MYIDFLCHHCRQKNIIESFVDDDIIGGNTYSIKCRYCGIQNSVPTRRGSPMTSKIVTKTRRVIKVVGIDGTCLRTVREPGFDVVILTEKSPTWIELGVKSDKDVEIQFLTELQLGNGCFLMSAMEEMSELEG